MSTDWISEKVKPEVSILLQLRQSAMDSHHDTYRKSARLCADCLDVAMSVFNKYPSFDNLSEVNGLTALAFRLMDKLQPSPDGGGGGSVRTEEYTETKVAA